MLFRFFPARIYDSDSELSVLRRGEFALSWARGMLASVPFMTMDMDAEIEQRFMMSWGVSRPLGTRTETREDIITQFCNAFAQVEQFNCIVEKIEMNPRTLSRVQDWFRDLDRKSKTRNHAPYDRLWNAKFIRRRKMRNGHINVVGQDASFRISTILVFGD